MPFPRSSPVVRRMGVADFLAADDVWPLRLLSCSRLGFSCRWHAVRCCESQGRGQLRAGLLSGEVRHPPHSPVAPPGRSGPEHAARRYGTPDDRRSRPRSDRPPHQGARDPDHLAPDRRPQPGRRTMDHPNPAPAGNIRRPAGPHAMPRRRPRPAPASPPTRTRRPRHGPSPASHPCPAPAPDRPPPARGSPDHPRPHRNEHSPTGPDPRQRCERNSDRHQVHNSTAHRRCRVHPVPGWARPLLSAAKTYGRFQQRDSGQALFPLIGSRDCEELRRTAAGIRYRLPATP